MRGRQSGDTAPTGNLFARSIPGGRTLIASLACLVPLSGAVLVALDARAAGSIDWLLAGAATGFAALSAVMVVQALRRLRCLAAVADAVSAASLPHASHSELTIDASLGRHAEHWNRLAGRVAGDGSAVSAAGPNAGPVDPVVNSLSEGVIVVDAQLSVILCNPAAAALLNGSSHARPGEDLAQAEPSALADLARTVLEGGATQRETLECGTTESPQVLRVRAARLAGTRDRAVLTLTDITRQSVAEASRGGFLARATHELRAPLTNIKLYAEQAIEEGDEDPQLRQESLNVIGREVLRLERTVGDLLRVSELESGAMRGTRTEIQVAEMLSQTRDAFAASAEAKSIELTLDIPPKLPTLIGDRDHIELVIQNLVGNAIKYTPDGGSVLLRADATDDQFSLEVIDDGIGIAPNEASMVFETFFRSDDERVHGIEGSGLGLSLARQLARQNGGDVTLESELNRGSTFTLRMPVGSGAEQATTSEGRRAA